MKLKHYQGYGSVNAKVTERRCNSYNNTKLIGIQVWGNHEYGLDVSDDYYDVYNWLLKRFAKDCSSYKAIRKVNFHYIADIDGQEAVMYEILYEAD